MAVTGKYNSSINDIMKIIRNMGYEDVKSAVERAKRNAVSGDLILVFGSFFLVSEFLATCA